jgi:hypothetical protein
MVRRRDCGREEEGKGREGEGREGREGKGEGREGGGMGGWVLTCPMCRRLIRYWGDGEEKELGQGRGGKGRRKLWWAEKEGKIGGLQKKNKKPTHVDKIPVHFQNGAFGPNQNRQAPNSKSCKKKPNLISPLYHSSQD